MISEKILKNAKFYRTDIFVWAMFIAYEVLLVYFLNGRISPIADYISAYAINISIFYINTYIVWPLIYKKPIYIGIAFILLEFIGYLFLRLASAEIYFILGFSKTNTASTLTFYLIASITYRFIYFIGISTAYWFALNMISQRKEISDLEKSILLDQLNQQQLERKLVDSEIAYLKSQINPHFLFNSLNFLHNSAIKSAPQLTKPILLLSDIMRYALTETPQNGKVELSEEIEQIASFIDLNQFRFDHNLQLSFTIIGNTANLQILPLILLTPVENIFKYADLKNTEYPVKINLEINNNELEFTINNKKIRTRKPIQSHGVGLKNLKLRLDTYYLDVHEIQIIETADDYTFKLQITL
ncbi:sensor histidine kinase YesM [Pedobacter cryoconitis]|uniref:Sensor histidine kinase YesM n=1 Tax=Pedobacter cryoconitis TaxID=188932 RepID=A0A7W8YRP4_9SPHI|nr:sensor histidine kinase [Pedobacter cryoconitis]MBB5620539.1 sensor histidine kinase YesM [Pedobacter cryoconitis]